MPGHTTKDPYAGLTLPEPPKGYRLAKWGEELREGAMWFGPMSNDWVPPNESKIGDGLAYNRIRPDWSIYAVPIESTLPKTWQFREEPWTAPEPETLADCPDNVDIIGCVGADKAMCIVFHQGSQAFWRHVDGTGESHGCGTAGIWNFIRYLDPQPATTLTLADVPDGRVIRDNADGYHYWKGGTHWLRQNAHGHIFPIGPSENFTITNLVAEFK